jgi:hypothetical protein
MTEKNDIIIKPEMKLYTARPYSGGPKYPTLFDLSEAIEGQVTGCNNWVYGCMGSPGVIVENPQGGHNIYGFHSRHPSMFDFEENRFFYGRLGNPRNLLHLIGHGGKSDRIVNGCVISINAVHGNDRKYDWSLWIAPDHDLREQFPEKFDDSLVESLERTVSDYIEKAGVSDRVRPAISSETAKMMGSPFHLAFYEQ